jgi:hypothetical protein
MASSPSEKPVPLYLLTSDEISPELLALLGPSTQVAEGRPHDIAKHFFSIAGGARSNAETWRLFAVDTPDAQIVPVLVQAVREGLEGQEFFHLKVDVPAVTATAVAKAAQALLRFSAEYRADPDKTGELLVPKPW